jgi:membrane dipeptidase
MHHHRLRFVFIANAMAARLATLVACIVVAIALLSAGNANAQEYLKLHKRAIVVDTHNDVLSEATMQGLDFETDLTGKTHSDLARFKKGGVDVQVFSIFCDDNYGVGSAFKYANREIDSLYAIAGRNPDKMQIVTDVTGIKNAVKHHRLAAMMGVEGGHMIEDNMDYLDSFYRRGVRYMTLTWNNSTSWATSALDESTKAFTVTPYGLTERGKAIVRHMNQLGMLVDLSHVGEQTFWDAIHTVNKPVLVSHSSVYALCPVFRNLKDDQIRAVAANGGVIQVNFYSGFLDSNYAPRMTRFMARHKHEMDSLTAAKTPGYAVNAFLTKKYPREADSLRAPLSLLIDHIDYIAKMIGPDHVGLGADFDGMDSPPQQMGDVTTYPLITRELLKRGYKPEDIIKILGGNFIRVLKANEVPEPPTSASTSVTPHPAPPPVTP